MLITRRKLDINEARLISHEIRNTGNIIYYSPRELTRFKQCFVAEDTEGLAGCFVVTEGGDFIDLKILIVLETRRGLGVGEKLFVAALERYQNTKKIIYLTTRNPVVVKMALTRGFSKIKLTKLPLSAIVYELVWSFNLKRLIVLSEKNKRFPELPPFEYYAYSKK